MYNGGNKPQELVVQQDQDTKMVKQDCNAKVTILSRYSAISLIIKVMYILVPTPDKKA